MKSEGSTRSDVCGVVVIRAQAAPGDHLLRLAFSGAIVVGWLLAGAGAPRAQTVDSTLWGVDPSGKVFAVTREGNTIYIGGNFNYVGPNSGGGVPIDVTTAHGMACYPKVTGRVNAAVADGKGGWYIGGWFSAVNGHSHANLAHVGPTSVDETWVAGTNNEVFALALAGKTLYVGGDFDSLGGAARLHLGAVDATTGTPAEWDPQVNDRVRTLLVRGEFVYAGGGFKTVGGQPHKYVAAIDTASGLASVWDPVVDGQVLALAAHDSTLFLGGYFANVGGQLRRYLAAVDASTGVLLPWNANVNRTPDFIYDGGPRVVALLLRDSLLYVAGSFKTIGGQYREGLAAVSAITAQATAWDPRAYSANVTGAYFRALASSGDTLFVGGLADSLGGVAGSYLAGLSMSTAARLGWDPRPNGSVNALAPSGGVLYAGGIFNSMSDWVVRRSLAALDAITGAVLPWNPECDGYVEALLLRGNTVYVGGNFSRVGGQARAYVAALDADTGRATSWNPAANGFVYALAPWGSAILVGGWFNSIGGEMRNNLAAIDTASALTTSWNPDADDIVYCIVPADSVIYVGGWFAHIGGLPHPTLVAFDSESGQPTSWAPTTDGFVEAIAVLDGTVYVGGVFGLVNGTVRERLAALDGNGEVTSWVADADDEVHALVAGDSTIYAAGFFNYVAGRSQSSLIALDARTGSPRDWYPTPDGYVWGLAASQGRIYAVGTFGRMSNWPQSGLAAITPAEVAVPSGPEPFALSQSIPNPTHDAAVIRYSLPSAARVNLDVFDLQGRRASALCSREIQTAGPHQVTVSTSGWRPGCYFYRLETGAHSATRRMVVIR